jgi:hypothetical protein
MKAFTVNFSSDGFTTGAAAATAALRAGPGSKVFFLGLLNGWIGADGSWRKRDYGLARSNKCKCACRR